MLSDISYPEPKVSFAPESVPDDISVEELPSGAVLEAETGHHTYWIENRGNGEVFISGHPQYCPEPVRVTFLRLIARGGKMQFLHPEFGVVSTSRVLAIRRPIIAGIGRA